MKYRVLLYLFFCLSGLQAQNLSMNLARCRHLALNSIREYEIYFQYNGNNDNIYLKTENKPLIFSDDFSSENMLLHLASTKSYNADSLKILQKQYSLRASSFDFYPLSVEVDTTNQAKFLIQTKGYAKVTSEDSNGFTIVDTLTLKFIQEYQPGYTNVKIISISIKERPSYCLLATRRLFKEKNAEFTLEINSNTVALISNSYTNQTVKDFNRYYVKIVSDTTLNFSTNNSDYFIVKYKRINIIKSTFQPDASAFHLLKVYKFSRVYIRYNNLFSFQKSSNSFFSNFDISNHNYCIDAIALIPLSSWLKAGPVIGIATNSFNGTFRSSNFHESYQGIDSDSEPFTGNVYFQEYSESLSELSTRIVLGATLELQIKPRLNAEYSHSSQFNLVRSRNWNQTYDYHRTGTYGDNLFNVTLYDNGLYNFGHFQGVLQDAMSTTQRILVSTYHMIGLNLDVSKWMSTAVGINLMRSSNLNHNPNSYLFNDYLSPQETMFNLFVDDTRALGMYFNLKLRL